MAVPKRLLTEQELAHLDSLGFRDAKQLTVAEYDRAARRDKIRKYFSARRANAVEKRKAGMDSTLNAGGKVKAEPVVQKTVQVKKRPTHEEVKAAYAWVKVQRNLVRRFGPSAKELIRVAGTAGAGAVFEYGNDLLDAAKHGPLEAMLVAELYGRKGLTQFSRYGPTFWEALDLHHEFVFQAITRANASGLSDSQVRQVLVKLANTNPSIVNRHNFIARINPKGLSEEVKGRKGISGFPVPAYFKSPVAEKFGVIGKRIVSETGELGLGNLLRFGERLSSVASKSPADAALLAEYYGGEGLDNLRKYGKVFLDAVDLHNKFALQAMREVDYWVKSEAQANRVLEESQVESKKRKVLRALVQTNPTLANRFAFIRQIRKGLI